MKTPGAKPTRQMVREVVHMMMKDETLGIRADGKVYTIAPMGSSRYLTVRETDGKRITIGTMWLTDFIDKIYGYHENAKVVRI